MIYLFKHGYVGICCWRALKILFKLLYIQFESGARHEKSRLGGLNDQVQHLIHLVSYCYVHYHHLSAEERAAIMLMQAKHSLRDIARHLVRSVSTVVA